MFRIKLTLNCHDSFMRSMKVCMTSTRSHGFCCLQENHLQLMRKRLNGRISMSFCSTLVAESNLSLVGESNLSLVGESNLSLVGENNSSLVGTIQDATTLISEPSLTSLGLGGLTPKGLVQYGIEALHTGLDIPWWSAIVIGTICIRIVIFPLVIIAQRNAANLNNHMPTLQRLQQRMTQARTTGNAREAYEISQQMMEFMKVNDVKPFKNLLVPLAQVPIFLSVFTGVREMANLPVESLKTGGCLWFTDLTIPDPFYMLPLLTATTLYLTVEAGVDGIKANQIGSSTVKLILRSMPFIAFPFMINFPSAMLCYWFTSNAFSLLQVLTLKIPKVKTYFSIPQLIDHQSAHPIKEIELPKQSFFEGFQQSIKNIELAKQIEERKHLDSLKMKESSRTPTDPTETSVKQSNKT